MSSLMNWNTTAASNNEAAPDGAPENMAPSGVNNTIREIMARVKEMQAALPWTDYGKGTGTVTYSMTLSNVFEVEGNDVTAQYIKGRRIKAVGTTTGTIYGTIETSTFTVNTKVYVNWDASAELQSETLSIQLGLSPIGLPEQRTNPPIGYRNWLINGDFDIWQRATTLTSSFGVYGRYLADRWRIYASSITTSAGLVSFDLTQTDVPDTPKYYLAIDVGPASATADFAQIEHYIEGVRQFFGKDVCASFYAKSSDPGAIIECYLVYSYGGATAAGTSSIAPITLTDTWKQYFFTKKVPDAAATVSYSDYLQLLIRLQGSGATVTSITGSAKTFYFSHMQLEYGVRPTNFEKRPFGVELELCKRYFQKSYNWNILPGTINSGNQQDFYMGAGQSVLNIVNFSPEMRIAPTLHTYSPNTGTIDKVYSITETADKGSGWQNTGTRGSNPFLSTSASALQRLLYHWTADCDFTT